MTVCNGIANRLRDRYGIERPLVIYNSVPAPEPRPSAPIVRQDTAVPLTNPLAVFVGIRQRHRGLEALVAALARVQGLHLAMVGPSADGLDDVLLDMASEAGCRDRLHLLPAVTHAQVSQYVATADFGIIP